MTQWQPIETMPYEVDVLVYSPTDGCVNVAHKDPVLGIYDGHHDITDYEEVTHWMPLPEPPRHGDAPGHRPTELIAFHPEDEFNEPTDERLVVKRGQDCVILSAQEIIELVEFVCESNRLQDVAALLPQMPEPPKTRAQVEDELAEEGYAYDP